MGEGSGVVGSFRIGEGASKRQIKDVISPGERRLNHMKWFRCVMHIYLPDDEASSSEASELDELEGQMYRRGRDSWLKSIRSARDTL